MGKIQHPLQLLPSEYPIDSYLNHLHWASRSLKGTALVLSSLTLHANKSCIFFWLLSTYSSWIHFCNGKRMTCPSRNNGGTSVFHFKVPDWSHSYCLLIHITDALNPGRLQIMLQILQCPIPMWKIWVEILSANNGLVQPQSLQAFGEQISRYRIHSLSLLLPSKPPSFSLPFSFATSPILIFCST